MNEALMPFIWVGISLPILLLLQRWIERHLGGLSLLLTGKAERAYILYALLLFPGVLLHEVSHWVMAKVLGVRTGSFSVIPRIKEDGTLQLGYVTYYKGTRLGSLRESLIGGAPLLVGTIVILLIGHFVFGVTNLPNAIQHTSLEEMSVALGDVLGANDFLVWLYLIFAISNAMLPSRSDRQAWPAFLFTMGGLAIVLLLLGLFDVVLVGLAEPTAVIFGYLGLAFSMAIGVDIFFMLVIYILETVVSRIRGISVVYGSVDAGVGERVVM